MAQIPTVFPKWERRTNKTKQFANSIACHQLCTGMFTDKQEKNDNNLGM